jgi:hypothetical protein
VTNFTLTIDELTCSKYNPSNCGGEGIAFVLQQYSPTSSGGAGHNLGYGKIPTSYAVEFDTNSNEESSDPKLPKKRHISIIRKEGDPNLVDTPGKGGQTIAWNDLPFNFNNPNEEGYIKEAHIRIEYFAKMFRVYINDAIQVSLYDPPLFNENEES